MNIGSIITSVAIALLVVGLLILNTKTNNLEEEVDNIATEKADDKRVTEISNDLDKNEVQVAYWQEEIDKVIKQMQEIVEDIGRLDEQHAQDHRDLVDIRERYILWREEKDEPVRAE